MLARVVKWLTLPCSNPHYPQSDEEVEREWQRLAARPPHVPAPARPVLVLAGYRAPQAQPRMIAEALHALCGASADDVLPLSYAWMGDPLHIACLVERAARARFGIRPVDVVGVSMGGLMARVLDTGLLGPRLAIARAFTIATPHRGALMARVVRPDACAGMMRPGSPLLRALDAARPNSTMELVCYARLGDRWVGTRHCAPPGEDPIWSPGLAFGTHFVSAFDRRALVDIARRLLGLEPWARPGALPATAL